MKNKISYKVLRLWICVKVTFRYCTIPGQDQACTKPSVCVLLTIAALNQGTAMERFECACSTVEWTLWMENIIIAVFKEGCYRWTFVNAFNLVLRLPYQNYYQFHVMYFSCSNVMSCKLWLLKFLIWNIFKECNPTDCIIR